METTDKSMGAVLGEIGRKFRSNIENHIKDYELQKDDDVEWLLEPLDAISHSQDIVLDAFQIGTKWESFYKLYFHNKDATQTYVPYNEPFKEPSPFKVVGNKIVFLKKDEIEKVPDPNQFERTMLIKETLNVHAGYRIPAFWSELNVQFSEAGVWQAVLLNEIAVMFPKGWHANQWERTFIFSREDLQQIVNDKKGRYDYTDEEIEKLNAYWKFLDMTPHFDQYKKSNYDRLVSYLDREDILPSVDISGDKAVASFCYWSDWRGFCRASVPVKRCGHSVAIGKPNDEILIAYDCGWRY